MQFEFKLESKLNLFKKKKSQMQAGSSILGLKGSVPFWSSPLPAPPSKSELNQLTD